MKRTFFLIALLAVFGMTAAVASNANGVNDTNDGASDWPWNFPKATKMDIKVGQTVLAHYSLYPSAVADGDDLTNSVLIFYSTTVEGISGDYIVFDDNRKVPSSLVIPIPSGQIAKKGDVVLTWWQSGSGMDLGCVSEGGAEPKVNYLEMSYEEDGSGFANRYADEQLAPNSFYVLQNGVLQPGCPVAYKGDYSWNYGILINKSKDRALISGFASHVVDAALSDVKAIPVKPDYKVGDKVGYVRIASFSTGTVKKIDMKVGRVWIDNGGDVDIVSITQVCKELAGE